jgi:type IV pilus assembly protein PilB
LIEQQTTRGFLGQILLRRRLIQKEDLAQALQEQLGLPYVDLTEVILDPELADLLPQAMVRRYRALPFSRSDDQLLVAMADPLNLPAIEAMHLTTGLQIRPHFAIEEEVSAAINQLYDGRQDLQEAISESVEVHDQGKDGEDNGLSVRELQQMVEDAPVVRLVDSVIMSAVNQRASDIHVEPRERDLRVRYRVDGMLYQVQEIPKKIQPAVISRIKIMAGMNIAERRHPQDGRISVNAEGRDYDLRVATMLTVHGEKVVMRLLDKSAVLLQLEDLGFLPEQQETVERLVGKPYGMLLVTGPTGAGKTTTLYTALNWVNTEDRNLITVEDPVEYQIPGINQSQVNVAAGITFARGLRSILRQDPDVVMVGEIRDSETAEIAVQAALTGHLVFSSLHTNDAPSAVLRLLDMGVEPFLTASSVIGVIGQRLSRTICQNCKEAYEPDDALLAEFGLRRKAGEQTQFYRGTGCRSCSDRGYRGRTGVFEVMRVTDEIRRLIVDKRSANEVRQAALAEGMIPMKECGLRKVLAGQTTAEEVLRVIYLENE